MIDAVIVTPERSGRTKPGRSIAAPRGGFRSWQVEVPTTSPVRQLAGIVKEVPAEVHDGAYRRVERHFRLGRSSDLDPSVDKSRRVLALRSPKRRDNSSTNAKASGVRISSPRSSTRPTWMSDTRLSTVRRTCSTGAAAIAGADCRLKEGVCGECVQRAKGEGDAAGTTMIGLQRENGCYILYGGIARLR
jgi:hypothetical protein